MQTAPVAAPFFPHLILFPNLAGDFSATLHKIIFVCWLFDASLRQSEANLIHSGCLRLNTLTWLEHLAQLVDTRAQAMSSIMDGSVEGFVGKLGCATNC